MNIGFYGVQTDNAKALVVGNNIFNMKIPVSKSMECLQLLTKCGFVFDGINLNEKKQDLLTVERIKITYPDDPAVLIGLKVMATAEIELDRIVNQMQVKKLSTISYCRFSDIFLRCDYRVLKNNNDDDVLSVIKDTMNPLSGKVQDFILQLHQRYLDKGLKCNVDIKIYG